MNLNLRSISAYVVPALIAVSVLLTATPEAFASPVLRTGENISVGNDQIVEGDLYIAADAASISGVVEGDAYVIGGTVTINGRIAADAVLAGRNVQLHAPVGDDVRIIGGVVVIAGEVEGDVIVLGGTVKILDTARIKGDVLFLTSQWGFTRGDMLIQGPVEGTVYGSAQSVRIDSSVGGDVDVRTAESFVLGDSAEVLGNVKYSNKESFERAQGAVVVGEIQHTAVSAAEEMTYEIALLFVGMLLVSALSFFLIMKPTLGALVDRARTHFGTQGLVGLGVFVGFPVAVLVLMFSMIGAFLGFLLLLLYIILLLSAMILSGPVMASLLIKQFDAKATVSFTSVVLGIFLYVLLLAIPVVGPLIIFGATMIVLGGLAHRVYRFLIQTQ